jgi:hypothetical protein
MLRCFPAAMLAAQAHRAEGKYSLVGQTLNVKKSLAGTRRLTFSKRSLGFKAAIKLNKESCIKVEPPFT